MSENKLFVIVIVTANVLTESHKQEKTQIGMSFHLTEYSKLM